MRDNVENDIRRKLPAVARGADYGRSAVSAIKGKCISCVGGSRKAVAECEIYDCWLWRFRPYGDRERPPGCVPTLEELNELASARTVEGSADALRKHAEGDDE